MGGVETWRGIEDMVEVNIYFSLKDKGLNCKQSYLYLMSFFFFVILNYYSVKILY